MAKKTSNTFKVQASPDKVYEVLTSQAFEEANQASQDGVKSIRFQDISRDDHGVKYEVFRDEVHRGLKGNDPSKTDKGHVVVTWRAADHSSIWSYTSSASHPITVSGATRIVAAGDGASITTEFNADVRVPLLGGKIEKMILAEVDKTWPSYERLVHEHLAK
jgi:hypothetical protein